MAYKQQRLLLKCLLALDATVNGRFNDRLLSPTGRGLPILNVSDNAMRSFSPKIHIFSKLNPSSSGKAKLNVHNRNFDFSAGSIEDSHGLEQNGQLSTCGLPAPGTSTKLDAVKGASMSVFPRKPD